MRVMKLDEPAACADTRDGETYYTDKRHTPFSLIQSFYLLRDAFC